MSLKKNVFDIVKFCNAKTCEKVSYAKIVTGGNDPSISKAMRYSQNLKNSRSGSVLYKVRIPDPPINILAVPGIGSAYVSWPQPNYYGGTKILYYIVITYAADNEVAHSKQITYTTHITVSGLTNGSSYKFFVIAVNTVGSSASSLVSNSIIPRTYAATPQIVNLTNNKNIASQLLISWSFRPNLAGIYDNGTPLYDGGGTITSYTIQPMNSNILFTVPDYQITTTTSSDGKIVIYSTVLQGLTSGYAYSFKITATNDAGDSPYSAYSITQIVP